MLGRMEATQLVGPLVLFALMTIVGLELTLDDFRRVASAPRAVVGGTIAQIVLLPLLTWAVVALLDVTPVFGAGAVLIAVAPGAGISNILTALAGANTALSVSLTALASVLAVVTLPTIAAFGMRFFLGGEVAIEVPVFLLFGQLAASLLLPIALGMALRARRPALVERYRRRLQRGAIVAIVILTGAAILSGGGSGSGGLTFADAEQGLLAAGVWTLAAMAIGWGVAAVLGLGAADRFTLLIEFATRNVAVAAIVAISGLKRLDLALFSAAYVALGYPLVFGAVAWRRRRSGG
jgi:BASS family bile acid:Na+ symporter